MRVILRKNTSVILISIFFATSFLIVTVFNRIALAIVFFLFLFVLLLKIRQSTVKLNLAIEDLRILFLFYLFIIASFAVVGFFNLFFLGMSYIEYFPEKHGRMINIIIYLTIFLFIVNERNNGKISTKTLFRAYTTGCCILLFFGLWQIFYFVFHVPFPNFETRTHIHSTEDVFYLPFMTRRVTSIAREPAFLMPFLIDAIVILFYTTKKYLFIILFMLVLFYSLSLAGYVNIFLISTIMLFIAKKTMKTHLIKIGVLLFGTYIFFLFQNVFVSVFQRLNPNALFTTGRLQNSILSIRYMLFEAPLFNIIFGFGPNGMGYIRNCIYETTGWLISVTTHVIFVDFFVEHGLIGVVVISLLFYNLFLLSTKVYSKTGNRLGQVLCLNLIITSLYTADFTSPRFTAIIILLLCLYKDIRNNRVVVK